MATQTVSYTSYDVSTAAGVRAFGSSVSSAIQAAGLTKTANTGQIDWGTVNPALVLGAEMYQFNDSLQTTAPVFVRIQYNQVPDGSNNPTWPYISSIQVARATNGDTTFPSGNVATISFNGTLGSGTSGAGNWNWRFCYNAAMGFFGITQWDDPNVTTGVGQRNSMFISRACDETGAPTTSGLWMQAIGAAATNANGNNQFFSYDLDQVATFSTGAIPSFNLYGTLMVGTTVQFLRQIVAYPTIRTIPQVPYYANPDLPRGTVVTLSPYGTPHTYITAGNVSTSATNAAYAMLWE